MSWIRKRCREWTTDVAMRAWAGRLRKWAELLAAVGFALMFAIFLLQIFMRYVINRPLGWTLEACLIAYLWVVFWGAAFLLREDDHVAFNLLYHGVPDSARRWLAVLIAAVIGIVFLAAVPATYDFVRFMSIESSSVLEIRLDLVFSVFLLFMVAVIVRSALRVRRLCQARWRHYLDTRN